MSKRKEFYVTSKIWQDRLGCYAKNVLAYLCFCANKDGECFPSIRRIADECNICPNTARKAIAELESYGLIEKSNRLAVTPSGARQTSNRYVIKIDRAPRMPLIAEAAADPVKPCDTGGAAVSDNVDVARAELDSLLKRLDLRNTYTEKNAAKAIELAICEMWFEENFRFRGEPVPQFLVRRRLNDLDINAVDEVMDMMDNPDVKDKAAYLKACIYSAPLQANARISIQRAGMLHGINW